MRSFARLAPGRSGGLASLQDRCSPLKSSTWQRGNRALEECLQGAHQALSIDLLPPCGLVDGAVQRMEQHDGEKPRVPYGPGARPGSLRQKIGKLVDGGIPVRGVGIVGAKFMENDLMQVDTLQMPVDSCGDPGPQSGLPIAGGAFIDGRPKLGADIVDEPLL